MVGAASPKLKLTAFVVAELSQDRPILCKSITKLLILTFDFCKCSRYLQLLSAENAGVEQLSYVLHTNNARTQK